MSGTTTFVLFRITIEPGDNDESYETFQAILDDPLDEYQKMALDGNQFVLDAPYVERKISIKV